MRKSKTVMPGVVRVTGPRTDVLRYMTCVNGKRFNGVSTLPMAVALNDRGNASRELVADYKKWQVKCAAEAGKFEGGRGLKVPSIEELWKIYEEEAWKRSRDPDYRKPSERSINSTEMAYWQCVAESKLDKSAAYTDLFETAKIKEMFEAFRKRMKGISAHTYVISLQRVTATWTIPKYRARGYDVKPPIMPDFGKAKAAPEYQQLSPELRAKIEKWYAGLKDDEDPRLFLAASMTFQLAMRPNDVGRLTGENFKRQEDGYMHLVYKPHKTAESSNRRVDWPVAPALWNAIESLAGERMRKGGLLLPHWTNVYRRLNESMRTACDMDTTGKAVYELRKLCIDTVYHRMGADYAVSLSGDRRETIERYYSDPYKINGIKPTLIAEF